jgi:hypothetical protein
MATQYHIPSPIPSAGDAPPPADTHYLTACGQAEPAGYLVGCRVFGTKDDLAAPVAVKCAGLYAVGHVPDLKDRAYRFGDTWLAHLPSLSQHEAEDVCIQWQEAFKSELPPLYPGEIVVASAEVLAGDRTLVRAAREVLRRIEAARWRSLLAGPGSSFREALTA